jgi:hypothetical protein
MMRSVRRTEDRLRACPKCGAPLEIDLTTDEDATVRLAARGGEPNVWVVEQGAREIHRCAVDDSAGL